MNNEIISQIKRAKELLGDLKNHYNTNLKEKSVSHKTRNLTQEILQKLRNILDQIMYQFFSKYIAPILSPEDRKKAERRVYFPIITDRDKFSKNFRKIKCTNFQTLFPNVYSFLDSVQPYNKDFEWLEFFRDKSNERHLRLVGQVKIGETATTLGDGVVKIKNRGTVILHNTTVKGVLVKEKTINIDTPINTIDPKLNPKRTWASIVFEDTEIDVLQFCKEVVLKVPKIILAFDKFI